MHLPAAGVRQDAAYKARKAELEALPAVDYEAVNRAKLEMLRKLYSGAKGKATLSSAEYKAFAQANREWLLPYAVFSVLRDLNGTPEFSTWKELGTYNAKKVQAFADAHASEVGFYGYVQFLLDRQLKEAERLLRHPEEYRNLLQPQKK